VTAAPVEVCLLVPPAGDGTPRCCRVCSEVLRWDTAKRDRRARGGRSTSCRPCDSEIARRRYAANPEAERSRLRARYAAHVEAERARHLAYRSATREARREDDRTRRALYAARTPEEVEAARARLRPDGSKTCRRCREVLPLGAFGRDAMTPDGLRATCRPCEVERVESGARGRYVQSWQDRDLFRCYITGAPLDDPLDPMHVEHMLALDNGGEDVPHNTAPAVGSANLRKGTRPLLDVIAEHYPGALDAVASWPVYTPEGDSLGVTLKEITAP
jgi:hypothetical protein